MSIDSRVFRQTVGQFVTGVTVIATEVDGSIRAMTANSFTVALARPASRAVLCRQEDENGSDHPRGARILCQHPPTGAARAFDLLRRRLDAPATASFAFLGMGGRTAARRMCRSHRLLDNTIHEGGDHWIVVGKVLALHRLAHASPLIFHGGRYANIGATFEAEILVSGF